ncbi:MAG TPA: Hsp20/alpha crystallin family protein [Chitinophagaceae bacterium]|nr:Hsp20/alpha crystallin family protein [Chitinophagaceae bacterium]
MSTRALTKTSEFLTPSLLDDFFKPWNEWFSNGNLLRKATTVPAVNITESENEYQVSLAAPGLKKGDFKVDLDGNMLSISSEKEESKEEKEGKYNRKEYSYSSFSRSFTLPEEVNQDKIEATYEDGVLKLKLPKKENAKRMAVSKHIAVK